MSVNPPLHNLESAGESPVPDEALVAQLYEELRQIARDRLRAERVGHTLTATALVHEAFLRLEPRRDLWPGRSQFLFAAAEAMKRILIDHARKRNAIKRGGPGGRAGGGVDLAEIPSVQPDAAAKAAEQAAEIAPHLETLARVDPDAHRVVMLRYFAGLSAADTADMLGVDRRTVTRRWNVARAWLFERLRADGATACREGNSDQAPMRAP